MHVSELFSWHRRNHIAPPHPPPVDFQSICPDFVLADTKEVTWDFETPKIVQAAFYAMMAN